MSIEQQASSKKSGEIRYLTPLNIETNKGYDIPLPPADPCYPVGF